MAGAADRVTAQRAFHMGIPVGRNDLGLEV
jgi:hypothetical protein